MGLAQHYRRKHHSTRSKCWIPCETYDSVNYRTKDEKTIQQKSTSVKYLLLFCCDKTSRCNLGKKELILAAGSRGLAGHGGRTDMAVEPGAQKSP